MILWSSIACTPPPEPRDDGAPPVVDTDPAPQDTGRDLTTGATGDTAATSDTAAPGPDCSLLIAPRDITWAIVPDIQTEEDFDFDADGGLLTQYGTALASITREGARRIFAPNVGLDASGIRSTVDGFVLVAQPDQGLIRRVDPATGASTTVLAGLSNPNGIEAGDDGMIYVTESSGQGRLQMVNPANGSTTVIASTDGNGVVLSPDERTLYFTSYDYGNGRILSVARDEDGTWESLAWDFYERSDEIGSLTADACGNLYGVEYRSGRVLRVDPVTQQGQVIAELGGGGSFSAIHFAPGFGGWDATALYVTNRDTLFEIPTGVPGSHVLTP